MAAVSARSMQVIRPHIPLIKFRKSPPAEVKGSSASHRVVEPAPVTILNSNPPVASKPVTAARIVLEDYQLPARYKRKPLTQEEIDSINMGGAY